VFRAMVRHNLARKQGEILLIAGPPGTGKSHLQDQLVALAMEMLRHTGAKRPVILLLLESAANLKDLSRQLAREIGNPVTMHKILEKSSKDISFEVLDDLVRLGVRFIFLDEAHNLLLSKPDDASVQLAKWLKNLTYKGISLVFSGLPEFRATLSRYGELVSRLYRPTPIETTALTGRTDLDLDAAVKFLGDLEHAYQVPANPHFDDARVALPLISCTQGNQRMLLRVVQAAVGEYENSGGSELSLEHFRTAAGLVGLKWEDEP
jgi:energy-coupling factor transporter ATP-binding protein EcfA2